MFCKTCGKQLPDGSKFCSGCGAAQDTGSTYNTYNTYNTYTQTREAKPSVSFLEASKLYFVNYVNFKTRSRRSEYWWATLMTCLLGFLCGLILPDATGILSLVFVIPSLSLCVRRLHDIGKSGWWYLLNCIPLVGSIILLVWYCQDSGPDNQWGPNPKF